MPKWSKPRMRMSQVFADYMDSDEWKKVCLEVKKQAKSKCRDCKQKIENGTTHHKSYYNWGKSNYQETEDCEWLCKKCHNLRHRKHIDEEVPFWAERNPDLYIVDRNELQEAVNLLD